MLQFNTRIVQTFLRQRAALEDEMVSMLDSNFWVLYADVYL